MMENKTIKIGNQIWMTENLQVQEFRNGDKFHEAKTNEDWIYCAQNKIPAWCNYQNEPKLGKIFGKLFNYWAIIDERGLAPEGWRIATENDWEELIEHQGGIAVASEKIKSINDWGYYEEEYLNAIILDEKKNNNVMQWNTDQVPYTKENNETGFTALPGGSRSKSGTFVDIGVYAYWWSVLSKKNDDTEFLCECIYAAYASLALSSMRIYQEEGFSVRCVKNI